MYCRTYFQILLYFKCLKVAVFRDVVPCRCWLVFQMNLLPPSSGWCVPIYIPDRLYGITSQMTAIFIITIRTWNSNCIKQRKELKWNMSPESVKLNSWLTFCPVKLNTWLLKTNLPKTALNGNERFISECGIKFSYF